MSVDPWTVVARRERLLHDLAHDLKLKADQGAGVFTPIAADVSKEEDVQRIASTIRDLHSRVDILVNAAGTDEISLLRNLSH